MCEDLSWATLHHGSGSTCSPTARGKTRNDWPTKSRLEPCICTYIVYKICRKTSTATISDVPSASAFSWLNIQLVLAFCLQDYEAAIPRGAHDHVSQQNCQSCPTSPRAFRAFQIDSTTPLAPLLTPFTGTLTGTAHEASHRVLQRRAQGERRKGSAFSPQPSPHHLVCSGHLACQDGCSTFHTGISNLLDWRPRDGNDIRPGSRRKC